MKKLTADQRKELLDEIDYNRKNCFLSSKTEMLMQIAEAALIASPVASVLEHQEVELNWKGRELRSGDDLYAAPPVPALKPIELKKVALMISAYATDPMNEDPVLCLSKDGVIAAIRAAGYEVTE